MKFVTPANSQAFAVTHPYLVRWSAAPDDQTPLRFSNRLTAADSVFFGNRGDQVAYNGHVFNWSDCARIVAAKGEAA